MLRPDSQNKYDPNNLILYRTSLALYRNMAVQGIFSEEEYCHIRTIQDMKKNPLPVLPDENETKEDGNDGSEEE